MTAFAWVLLALAGVLLLVVYTVRHLDALAVWLDDDPPCDVDGSPRPMRRSTDRDVS